MTRRTGLAVAVATGLLLAACSASPPSTGSAATAAQAGAGESRDASPAPTARPTTAADPTGSPGPAAASATDPRCTEPADATPWEAEAAVEVPVVATLDDGTVVRAARYPRPSYDASLWSQWGQGIVLDDGRVLSAIGDHEGVDGNSFLFVYEPDAHRLVRIGDVLSVTGHVDGDWGFGKVHAQMVAGPCGDVVVSTYWGTRRGLTFTDGYRGDVLLRIDPVIETISRLGDVVLDGHGVASLAATPDGRVLYAEAVDPVAETGAFVALDGVTGERLFVEEDVAVDGLRATAVTEDGEAVLTWDGTGIARFDPTSMSLEVTSSRLPGRKLRAADREGGRVLAVTQDPPVLFAIDDDDVGGAVGAARGYTTSIVTPDGRRVWYVPDAHGNAHRTGAPLVELDSVTGEDRVLVELQPLVGASLDVLLGGTYNITASEDGSTVFVGMNASPGADDPDGDGFGEVVFVVVELP